MQVELLYWGAGGGSEILSECYLAVALSKGNYVLVLSLSLSLVGLGPIIIIIFGYGWVMD